MSVIYFFKKLVGLNTHYDDVAMMHIAWTGKHGVFLSVVFYFGRQLAKISTFLGGFIEVYKIWITGSSLLGKMVGKASQFVLQTFTVTVTWFAAHTAVPVVVAKYVVLLGVGLSVAVASMNAAAVIEVRGDQVRAVITDHLAHPVNFDLALNPAYHGKRDQLGQGQLLLTVDYLIDEQGEDYQSTPFVGFAPYYGPHTQSNLVVNTAYQDQIQQFIDEQNRKDFQDSLRTLGDSQTERRLALELLPELPINSTTGVHGLEVDEIHSRVIQVLHDGTVIRENYTTTVKLDALERTTFFYLVALYHGGLQGPKSFVNSITEVNGRRFIIKSSQ
jgi:hypothetical protein